MDTKDKLIGKLKEAGNLLNSAKCPDCNGSGIILSQTVKTGTKWIDDGHGNPLPEPYPIINHDQSPCFWCYYKDNLLLEIAALEKQETKPLLTADNIKNLLREYGFYGINHNEDANNKLIEALINLFNRL